MNKAERSAKADTAFKVLYKIQNLMKIQRFCEDTIPLLLGAIVLIGMKYELEQTMKFTI